MTRTTQSPRRVERGRSTCALEDGALPAGTYSYQLDAHSWPAGIYFVRLQAGDQIITKRIIKLQ